MQEALWSDPASWLRCSAPWTLLFNVAQKQRYWSVCNAELDLLNPAWPKWLYEGHLECHVSGLWHECCREAGHRPCARRLFGSSLAYGFWPERIQDDSALSRSHSSLGTGWLSFASGAVCDKWAPVDLRAAGLQSGCRTELQLLKLKLDLCRNFRVPFPELPKPVLPWTSQYGRTAAWLQTWKLKWQNQS